MTIKIRTIKQDQVRSITIWFKRLLLNSTVLVLSIVLFGIVTDMIWLKYILKTVAIALLAGMVWQDCKAAVSWNVALAAGSYYGLFIFAWAYLFGNISIRILQVPLPSFAGIILFPLFSGIIYVTLWLLFCYWCGPIEIISNRQCKTCGYDLRGSTNQCPECGQPFDEALLKKLSP